MSDILNKDFCVTFGKVISKKTDSSAQSAIESLLNPDNNMFENASAIETYMHLCKLSKKQVSEKLGIDERIVIHKLSLLKFSKTQRQIILQSGMSEKCAMDLARLPKTQRTRILKELSVLDLHGKNAQDFVYKCILEITENEIKPCEKRITPKKIIIRDVGFFFNTVDRAVKLMKSGGYEIENVRMEDEKEYRLDIKVKKNGKNN